MGAVLGRSGKASDQVTFKHTLWKEGVDSADVWGKSLLDRGRLRGRVVLVAFEEKHGDGVAWLCKESGKGRGLAAWTCILSQRFRILS